MVNKTRPPVKGEGILTATSGHAAQTAPPLSGKDVARWLRAQIRAGRFVSGQRLVEADIMRDTGASRGHVREAIQRLEAEGLLLVEEFRGASVKRFSEEDMRQVYRARMALEGMAAHDFAAFGLREEKERLQSLQGALDGAVAAGDHARFAALNQSWHDAIIAGACNAYVETFVQRLNIPLHRMLFSSFYNQHRLDRANEDHREITAAIIESRAEDAERLTRRHIAAGLDALLNISRG
jgi:DNA-binding GntR family transcriptional regulator